MKKYARLTDQDKVDIIEAYDIHLARMQDLADKYGCTRQAIWKILKSAGVDTSKRKIPVSCTTCGKTLYRTRARIRTQKDHFCNHDCYASYLSAGKPKYQYIQEAGNSSRIARKKVSEYYPLKSTEIVHHLDGNRWNNDIRNLCVLANQGDHIRIHHRLTVPIVWKYNN